MEEPILPSQHPPKVRGPSLIQRTGWLPIRLHRAIFGESVPYPISSRFRGIHIEDFTSRQKEVWQMLAEGQTTKAIALVLKLSPKCVEYHRHVIAKKLGT